MKIETEAPVEAESTLNCTAKTIAHSNAAQQRQLFNHTPHHVHNQNKHRGSSLLARNVHSI
jgi:hypothetical protein